MPTSRLMLQLLALVREYDREPPSNGSVAATDRDLDYFDRIMAVLSQRDEPTAADLPPGQPVPTDLADYRVRWEIDLSANSHVNAAHQARQVQLRPESLATVFDVLRRDGSTDQLDWSLAEEIDLTAHTKSDDVALDEVARVLRVGDWRGASDLPYLAELVQLTGRDTVTPVTPPEQIDWR